MLSGRLKGQSTLEYVILLGFVVSALIAMGVYMKRGAQGQLREATDRVGEQYEAGRTTSKYTIENTSSEHESLRPFGYKTTNIKLNEQKKLGGGWEEVEKLPDEPTETPVP